ncbi:MAG TPA: hypothetical protein IAC04_03090 [Candidatus Coprenecus stercoravium]|uniref:Major fimbrial subunit protein N-terminal domain-containing protein n=1 Tax=Candidatus Coprenecus stercoravium TaxID=2840735 RepID=A0A9D2GPV2_9BACT|nr:hypothetical protein [Candidatus Coprenecus stercoravium]
MKKILMLAAACGMLFSSCSKTSVEGNVDEGQDYRMIIALSSGSDALTVKSGRPLLSEAPGQDIQGITLYFVNEEATNNVVLKKVISESEWANALPYGDNTGKSLEISIKNSDIEGRLPVGTYNVYAVGYSDPSDFEFKAINQNDTWSDDNFYADIKGGAEDDGEEVFAGTLKVYVETSDGYNYLTSTQGQRTTPELVLNRQVAGVTGYFTNIPVSVNGKTPAKLRLIASGKNTRLNFVNLFGEETETGTTVNYVVNGSVSATAENLPYWNGTLAGYEVYTIDLTTWFPKGIAASDINGDGYVGWLDAINYVYVKTNVTAANLDSEIADLNTTWSTAIKGGEGNYKALSEFWVNPNASAQQLVAGSVFAGEFVIPFTRAKGNINTFELQLLDGDGSILKVWNIKVDQKNTGTVEVPVGVETPAADEDYIYSIYRNHMYSMGDKTLNAPGSDPDNPDPDPDPKPQPDPDDDGDGEDDPQDLNTTQDLQIHVNDQWEIIHDMELD